MERIDQGKNILILGGSGWIGFRLVRILMDRSRHRVECWVRSETAAKRLNQLGNRDRLKIRCSGDLTKYLPSEDTDIVIHAASPTMHWDLSGAIETNIGLTLKILEAMSRRKMPPRLIFLSTLLLRGNSEKVFSEDDLDAGQLFLTPYAQMKFLAETALRTSYVKDVESICVRIGSALWERNGDELPLHDWFCQSVSLWKRGFLKVLPLPAKHTFFPVPVDNLCECILRLTLDGDIPPVLHLPAVPGPTLETVFKILSESINLSPPIFCESDSDLWTDYLANLPNGLHKRRLNNLFPIPPKGAKLSLINSETTAQWLDKHNLKTPPLTDDYWLTVLQASSFTPPRNNFLRESSK
jgi:nucleoside-diphosphate-sugar epimerase